MNDQPSYLHTIPADEYHAATKRNEYITSHRLHLFRRCPRLFYKHMTGEIVEGNTAAFIMGSAIHTLTIEGREAFDREYFVSEGPMNPKTGKPYGVTSKAYIDWAALQPRSVITPDDFDIMTKVAKAVREHKLAAEILSAGFAEKVVRATWEGESLQARLDWFDPERGILADLKTCADIDRFVFDAREFGYIPQLAFYKKLLELAGYNGPKIRAHLIAVEKKEPFRVAVVQLFPDTLEDGNFSQRGASKYGAGNFTLLRELKQCREAGYWPTLFEDVVRL